MNGMTDHCESNTLRSLPPDSQFMKYFFLKCYAYLCHTNHSGSRAHDLTGLERHSKKQSRSTRRLIFDWHFQCGVHVAACLERIVSQFIFRRLKLCYSYPLQEHCQTLKESYHQCSYTRLVYHRQHPRHSASTRLYLGKNQHHRDSFGSVFDCCFDAAVQ